MSPNTSLSALRPEYEHLFANCKLRQNWLERIKQVAQTILNNRDRYEKVALAVNSLMPWYVVGLIHNLEAGFDWHSHLHNGDPLTQRTVHEPSDRPLKDPINGWQIGYSWEESAIDALIYDEFDQAKQWDMPAGILWHLELFNGPGYRNQGIYSPYLWSGTYWYEKGKYGSDGRYDSELVSQQVGAGAVLYYMQQNNLLSQKQTQATAFAAVGTPATVGAAIGTAVSQVAHNGAPTSQIEQSHIPTIPTETRIEPNTVALTSPSVAKLLINNPTHFGTYLKQSMAQSNTLPDSQKHWVANNSELPLLQWNAVDDYYFVTLNGLSFNGEKTWYIFKKHATIEPLEQQILSNVPAHQQGQFPPVMQPSSGAEVSEVPHPPAAPSVILSHAQKPQANNLWVQQQLIRLHLLDPPADGKWGVQSKAALASFQTLKGLSNSTGQLDSDTIAALADTEEIIILKLGTDFASRLTKYMRKKGYYVPMGKGRYSIVYVHALNEDFEPTTKTPDAWDDRRLLLEIGNDGVPRIINHWMATCDPGVAASQGSDIQGGVAQVAFGQYRAWQYGFHWGSGNYAPYPALCQVGAINIWRDSNRDNKRDQGDLLVPNSEGNGINQHHGWGAEIVGLNSEGCLVGKNPKGHSEFIDLCKQDVRYQINPNYVFYTTIIDSADLGIGSGG